MNPMELYLLGRRLMQIAESALPSGKSATVARLVLIDVAFHPDSSISEITERTALHQSQVSAAVGRLRERGVLETGPDPADRRRTLVRTTPAVKEIPRRTPISITDVLAGQLGAEQGERVTDAIAALDLLAELFLQEDEEG
jgi:hypothetical protein